MKTLKQTIMLLALASILPAYCQSAAVLRADIPFAFRVGDKAMEAGTYTLQNLGHGNVTLIRSEDGTGGALTTTLPLETWKASEPRLVFHRYDSNYFLSQIWTATGGGELPISRAERRIRVEDAALDVVDLALAN